MQVVKNNSTVLIQNAKLRFLKIEIHPYRKLLNILHSIEFSICSGIGVNFASRSFGLLYDSLVSHCSVEYMET